ncbi:MAG: hypothetical protein KGI54_04830 [Pseudomonadota bacterium]|nr:hypothetical protein [Pseudomonadota bacterium]
MSFANRIFERQKLVSKQDLDDVIQCIREKKEARVPEWARSDKFSAVKFALLYASLKRPVISIGCLAATGYIFCATIIQALSYFMR